MVPTMRLKDEVLYCWNMKLCMAMVLVAALVNINRRRP